MDKNDIFNYVMKTPDNTNPAILREMLDSISSSGNPNYVETITGTLANPWGDIDDPSVLHQSVLDRDASIELVIDASSVGYGDVPLVMSQFQPNVLAFFGVYDVGLSVEDWTAGTIIYVKTGILRTGFLLQNGSVTVLDEYASLLPTTLTIIHHPLPENNT